MSDGEGHSSLCHLFTCPERKVKVEKKLPVLPVFVSLYQQRNLDIMKMKMFHCCRPEYKRCKMKRLWTVPIPTLQRVKRLQRQPEQWRKWALLSRWWLPLFCVGFSCGTQQRDTTYRLFVSHRNLRQYSLMPFHMLKSYRTNMNWKVTNQTVNICFS